MAHEYPEKKVESRSRIWLRRLWGALPILVLIAVIMVLASMIKSKTDRLDAAKKGLQSLQGMQRAAAEMDRVVAALKGADDQNHAVEILSDELDFTEDQAKAVLHMPLSSLVRFERDRLAGQIDYVEKQIAAKKLDMPHAPPDVNVVTLALAPAGISDRINLPGVVEPWIKYNVVAEVRGQVTDKRVEKGAHVREGDIIVVLDTRDYEIALDAARASFNTALASKRRIEKLYQEQLASRSQLDDITAQVERFKAEVDSAELNLSRCTIRSPISGVINNIHIDRGQYLNFADPVAEVMQTDRLKVNVGIPESDVAAVRAVDDFEVRIDALNGRVFNARKYFLARASDPKARLYALEVEIDNPEEEILPDMFARVEIVKSEVHDALAVPLYAIISINDAQTVYVLSDGAARARTISTGIQEGWMMQVTEGLAPGDQVIVVGHRRVSDGQRVNVVRTVDDMADL
ncbi:MAG: efflux RND transporter periplasmic adaptor subunit [Desulfobacteraceae bacterium]|jgi:RND family efflux transporter MFP subunit|nr:MAG: efflux RND transporter periplasmic adaptor subunit [Desulfobacteraceae bacterium]